MKKSVFVFMFFLLFPSFVFSAPTVYDFEGGSITLGSGDYTNVVVGGGTPDPNQSTTGLDMEGDHCLSIDPGESVRINTGSDQANLVITLWLRWSEAIENRETIVEFRNSTTSTRPFYASHNAGPTSFRLQGGSGGVNGTGTYGADETHKVKFTYTEVSGLANDTFSGLVYVSAWTDSIQVAGGLTGDAQIQYFDIKNGADTETLYIDYIQWDTVDIADPDPPSAVCPGVREFYVSQNGTASQCDATTQSNPMSMTTFEGAAFDSDSMIYFVSNITGGINSNATGVGFFLQGYTITGSVTLDENDSFFNCGGGAIAENHSTILSGDNTYLSNCIITENLGYIEIDIDSDYTFDANSEAYVPNDSTQEVITVRYEGNDGYNGTTNQVVHPSVVYFPSGWNGYKYWMAITPYPDNDDAFENPSIMVSDTGLSGSWVAPPGVINPLASEPICACAGSCGASGDGVGEVAFNSDPSMIYNEATDELWMYYRATFPNTINCDYQNEDKIFLLKSSDGSEWTNEPGIEITTLEDVAGNGVSPSVIIKDDIYYVWMVRSGDTDKIYRYQSTDGEAWTGETGINWNGGGNFDATESIWHLEVKWIDLHQEYWMLLLLNDPRYLTWVSSTDGINWKPHEHYMIQKSDSGWDQGKVYKASFQYNELTNLLKIWYTGSDCRTSSCSFASGDPRDSGGPLWGMGYVEVEDFLGHMGGLNNIIRLGTHDPDDSAAESAAIVGDEIVLTTVDDDNNHAYADISLPQRLTGDFAVEFTTDHTTNTATANWYNVFLASGYFDEQSSGLFPNTGLQFSYNTSTQYRSYARLYGPLVSGTLDSSTSGPAPGHTAQKHKIEVDADGEFRWYYDNSGAWTLIDEEQTYTNVQDHLKRLIFERRSEAGVNYGGTLEISDIKIYQIDSENPTTPPSGTYMVNISGDNAQLINGCEIRATNWREPINVSGAGVKVWDTIVNGGLYSAVDNRDTGHGVVFQNTIMDNVRLWDMP